MTSDAEAWVKYPPKFTWVYNKLQLAQSQNILCGPMGVYPPSDAYPVVFKPIINLYGMSRSFKIVKSQDEYDSCIQDGLFWEPYFSGQQYTIDFTLHKGKVLFTNILCSIPHRFLPGIFVLHRKVKRTIPTKVKKWVNKHLKHFTGNVNMEVIDSNIIEMHLRHNGDSHFLTSHSHAKYIVPIFEYLDFSPKVACALIKTLVCKSKHDNIGSNYQGTYKRKLMYSTETLSDAYKAKMLLLT